MRTRIGDKATMDHVGPLLDEIAACRVCAKKLAHSPRPVVQLGAKARVLLIGQAPGRKVHDSGVPWDDDSGRRLRDWMGIGEADFYDPGKVAMLPMGFCYPGKASGGDRPPRPECAPLWHGRALEVLPPDRLTLLIGTYAHARYAPGKGTLAERVRRGSGSPDVFVLPHPAWRSALWMRDNPWFEVAILPELRAAVAARIR
jgi:uracil-DNA glycosylase